MYVLFFLLSLFSSTTPIKSYLLRPYNSMYMYVWMYLIEETRVLAAESQYLHVAWNLKGRDIVKLLRATVVRCAAENHMFRMTEYQVTRRRPGGTGLDSGSDCRRPSSNSAGPGDTWYRTWWHESLHVTVCTHIVTSQTVMCMYVHTAQNSELDRSRVTVTPMQAHP